jgi:uncharacterized phiE125 gp8 family phage protein
MALSLSSAPATEPVSVAEAKAHLRIDHAADDDYVEDFVIPAARRYAETITHRAFITQTWILRLNGFGRGGPIYLPRPPLVSITTVTYTDTAGTAGTAWAASSTGYTLEQPSGEMALHASIRPSYSQSYPSTRDIVDSVVITYVAGYGAASAVPIGIKHGILMLIEDLYRQRGGQIAGTISSRAAIAAESLLSPFIAHHYDLRFD